MIADKWFPSSQRCSECGHVNGKKPLGAGAGRAASVAPVTTETLTQRRISVGP
ncbi:hypothetical protein [Salinibacter ruber]|uniref:hypothetical protein n=1 Tax=Salinibacter ruber TaxID=146919 RepID=UPI003C6DCFED